MLYDYVVREINNLAAQFSKKLQPARLQTYADVVSAYDPSILSGVCKRFARQARMMPTPDEIGKACAQFRERIEQKKPALDSICRHVDPEESAVSRSLCDKQVEASDAEYAVRQFGYVVCRWHYDVLYSKAFPTSGRKIFIDQMLKSSAMRQTFNPSDLSRSIKDIVKPVPNSGKFFDYRHGSAQIDV